MIALASAIQCSRFSDVFRRLHRTKAAGSLSVFRLQHWLDSDFSTGLLGLLLSGSTALDNRAVDTWFEVERQRLLEPLGMRNTFLYVPAEVRGRTASGYQLALAAPLVTNGMVSDYSITSGGALYMAVPAVQVRGGPGGATATAKLEDCHVASLTPGQTGMNYRPPTVTFGKSSKTAQGEPVVVDGHVVAVKLFDPGATSNRPRLASASQNTATKLVELRALRYGKWCL
jgi:Beta-lactamase